MRDEPFRAEVRDWLEAELAGEFAAARGLGGPGREHEGFELRLAWERRLASGGWTCIGWPSRYGGRGAWLEEQVIFHEEYVRARAPARVGHFGENLLGPTLIAHGTDAQRERFLPPIVAGTELWCQGYSEPGAGSDLAGVRTRAVLDGDEWVVHGQKIWTSLAHVADWCFAVVRTDPSSRRHAGLSYLLIPMRSPGVEVRPIRQLTGTAEFNEVFFDGARTARDLVVGEPGEGWKVAMTTLNVERGVSTLGTQLGFRWELEGVVERARHTGALDDPVVRDAITRAWSGLEIIRMNALRTLAGQAESATGGSTAGAAAVTKLLWATWHRDLGELAIRVGGMRSLVVEAPYGLDDLQSLFLFSRADTIYGGSNEIQRTIIAERVLGLPKERRP